MRQELVQTPNGELEIQRRIRAIRGVQVMLDRDLAELYGVGTKVLNQAVKRNADRFPPDFMIRLTKEECLRSQSVTLNESRGKHLKYLQYKGLSVEHSDSFHDRYILIDNAELHNLGSSINYLGCRVTNYSTRDPKEIKKLHALRGGFAGGYAPTSVVQSGSWQSISQPVCNMSRDCESKEIFRLSLGYL